MDTAHELRHKSLQEYKKYIKKHKKVNILSIITILAVIIGLSMIAIIYYCNWYIL